MPGVRRLEGDLPGLGTGIYSYAEAAALLQVSQRRIRNWAQGYSYRVSGGKVQSGSVLQRPAYIEGYVTFNDLVELWWVKAFMNNGIRLPKIRQIAERLAATHNTLYPFANKKLMHKDGAELIDAALGKRYEVARTGQKVFEYVTQFLQRLEFDDDTPTQWHPPGYEQIVINPKRSFGAPIVERRGIRTDVLYETYIAEGRNYKAVADWYGVEESDVEAAVSFEEGWMKIALPGDFVKQP